jgi:hypothetical protein
MAEVFSMEKNLSIRPRIVRLRHTEIRCHWVAGVTWRQPGVVLVKKRCAFDTAASKAKLVITTGYATLYEMVVT